MDTQPAPLTNNTPIQPQPKNSTHFRLVFFFLLLAVLASALATTYILIGNKDNLKTSTDTSTDNPFDGVSAYSNPFEGESADTITNPFDETSSDNPFDQFADETSVTNSDTYQNPF